MKISTSALVSACLLMFGSSVRANLLLNGSFENGCGQNGLSCETLAAGTDSIANWSITQGTIDQEGSNSWVACDGLYSLDLNGTSAGAIEQSFSTLSGRVYLVTFCMAGNPSFQGVRTLRVSAAGQSSDFSFDTTGHNSQNLGWVDYNWIFIANGSSTTIKFQSLVGSAEGPALDNVDVEAVSGDCSTLQRLSGIVQNTSLGSRDKSKLLHKLVSAQSSLSSFIDSVNTLQSAGKLDAATANELTTRAADIIGQ